MTEQRVPPYDREAERAVIGACMQSSECLDEAADMITAEDFYVPAHATIWRVLLEAAQRGQVLDTVGLQGELERRGALEPAGGPDALLDLTEVALPSPLVTRRHCETTAKLARLRRVLQAATRVVGEGYGRPADPDALVEKAEQSIAAAAERRDDASAAQSIADIGTASLERLREIHERGGSLGGVPTGLRDLDALLGGMRPGELTIVGGRPGMGKTALGLSIARYVAGLDGTVFVASMEMPADQIWQRLVAAEARVPLGLIRGGQLDEKDLARITRAQQQLARLPIHVDETPSLTPLQLAARCRRLRRRGGLGLVVVDYLQLMRVPRSRSREQEIAEVSRAAKALAKDMGCPVMALAQLNRRVEDTRDRRPTLASLRESGQLEQDADQVIFVYRQAVHDPENADPEHAEIIIAKHRQGPTGDVEARYVGYLTRFEDAHEPRRDAPMPPVHQSGSADRGDELL